MITKTKIQPPTANDDFAIKVEHVSKKYCKSLRQSMTYGLQDIGRNVCGQSSHSDKLRKGEFWAVNDVSFELKKGDTLGLIGPNGSGKSTLLKMLNGIFWPDKGKITIKGRVGALIEVGAGFHPLLTGKENIYVNAAILGMTKQEADSKLDQIIQFADIGDFINAPVKTYSSGMFVRLGFAVAIHCDPDILLVDEALAVGDSNFVTKSLNKISSKIQENKMTVIYVSHNNTMIRAVCKKALYLDKGVCKSYGLSEAVLQDYEADNLAKQTFIAAGNQRILSDNQARITKVIMLNENKQETTHFKIGQNLTIRVFISADRRLENPEVEIVIFNQRGEVMVNQISKTDNCIFGPIVGNVVVDFEVSNLPFNVGVYDISVKLIDGLIVNSLDYHMGVLRFTVHAGSKVGYNGLTYLDGKWVMSTA